MSNYRAIFWKAILFWKSTGWNSQTFLKVCPGLKWVVSVFQIITTMIHGYKAGKSVQKKQHTFSLTLNGCFAKSLIYWKLYGVRNDFNIHWPCPTTNFLINLIFVNLYQIKKYQNYQTYKKWGCFIDLLWRKAWFKNPIWMAERILAYISGTKFFPNRRFPQEHSK